MPATDSSGVRQLRLRRIAPFVPPRSAGVPDLREELEIAETEVRLLTRFLGLDRIAIAEGIDLLDMLGSVGEAALDDQGRSEVRYLIHAHTVPLLAPPALRWMDVLRSKLGVEQARAFSISQQGCAIGLSALRLARSLLRVEPPGSTALLLVGEKAMSTVFRRIPNTTVMGEAIAGVLVGLDGPGEVLLGAAHRTLGEYYEAGHMSEETERRYRQAYRSELAAVMLDAVRDAGLTLREIDLVLPHNVNRYSWTATAQDLGLPLDRLYLENVPKLGHCFGADPFVNLATARADSVYRTGQTVLAVSAGQGVNFGAAVLAGPDREGE